MPQSNREIIPGWECLNFDINDEIWKVPSLQTIEELLFFPNLDLPDPYHLERYRIRPQNYEPENQKLLLIESNELVDLFERSEMDSYQLQVSKWCQEKGISYQEFLYHELSSTYCRQILVPSNPNPDKLRHLAPRLISLSPIDGTNCGGEIHDRLEAEFKNNQTKLNEVFNRVVLLNISCKTSSEIKSLIDKGKPLTQHVIKRIENSKNINNDGKKLLISLKDGSPAYMVISIAYLNNWSVRVACRRHNGNYLNKQANSFSFIRSKFLNP